MQAEEQQARYRKSCSLRRRGNVIERRNSEQNSWDVEFTHKAINAVKRQSRALQSKGEHLYVEAA